MIEYYPLVFYYFSKPVLVVIVYAVRGVHRKVPIAAVTKIELVNCIRKTVRSPPFCKMLRVAPCGEHLFSSRIEEAGCDDFAVCDISWHLSPLPVILASRSQVRLAFLPRTSGTARPNPILR